MINAYLTIDDAPSCDMIVKTDFLASRSIAAIWFCRGDLLQLRPYAALHAIGKGHVIANHAYTHRYFSDLPLPDCFDEIEKTDVIIESLYARAGVSRPGRYFRFPYGDKGGLKYRHVKGPYCGMGAERKDAIQRCLLRHGYSHPRDIAYGCHELDSVRNDIDWYWTCHVMEWAIYQDKEFLDIRCLEDIFRRLDGHFRGSRYTSVETYGREVVLLHDHHESTDIFCKIIDRLSELGLAFVLPSD